MKCTVTVEFGEDIGQSFGSLFEARTADGSFALGAGLCDVYNTRFRSDRHVVQFFARPTNGDRPVSLEPLPRPSSASGAYMFSIGSDLVAMQPTDDALARVWDATTGSWSTREGIATERIRLGAGELAFGSGQVWYDGRLILDAPTEGSYQRFYYANGHLCFYHVSRGERSEYRPWESDADGFSRLYACPWRPSDPDPVDLAEAITLRLPIVGETTFSWGQLGGEVLTCSNIGGVYVFDGSAWRMIREPALGASFQVYTMVRYRDRLLLGQYPSGELFAFDGDALERIEGWPPGIEGASPSARECQTAMVWGGELHVGVWPWGELWRLDAETDQWRSLGRLFTHPEVHADPIHPYEAQCGELGLVSNQWGQRVTSMVPLADSLMISTSAKWPFEPEPAPEFMAPEQLAEYGAVWRMKTPGCVAAPICVTPEPTVLEFEITTDEMMIRQNGLVLGRAALPEEFARAAAGARSGLEPEWGTGAYGPFGGAAIAGEIMLAP